MKQNFKNHRKYYLPHHLLFLPAMGFCTGLGAIKAYQQDSDQLVWTIFAILSFAILSLSVMLRQHYALGNQDRIIRLEFRLRYWQLYNESSQNAESKLSFSQIAALRFANDEEFKTLLERAIKENLSAGSIKRSIKDWQADNMRV